MLVILDYLQEGINLSDILKFGSTVAAFAH